MSRPDPTRPDPYYRTIYLAFLSQLTFRNARAGCAVTTPGISQRTVAALAALVHEIRPDWNEAGIAAETRRHAHLPVEALAVAMIRAACDRANGTPAALSQDDNRAWHDFRPWRCEKHPEQRACRTNGECASCYADRRADESATAVFVRRPVPQTARRRATPTAATPTRKATG